MLNITEMKGTQKTILVLRGMEAHTPLIKAIYT